MARAQRIPSTRLCNRHYDDDGTGNVSNMLLAFSYQQAEFIAIHNEPDHDIMPPHRFGKTEGFTHEALQPGPEREVFPFNLLRLSFANGMLCWSAVPIVHVCTIGIELVNAQRCHQCFSL